MKNAALVGFAGLILGLGVFHSRLSSDVPLRDPEFVYARIRYHITPEGFYVHEVPWHHDYPFSDQQFPAIVAEVSNIRTASSAYQIVDIDSPELFKYPFAYLCEPGYLELNDKDVIN